MRNTILKLAVAMLSLNAVSAPVQYAVPRSNEVPVYSSEMRKVYEKPLFFINTQDKLNIRESGKNMMKIVDKAGRSGWVESSLVSVTSVNEKFVFSETDVPGYIDAVTPLQILDADLAYRQGLSIERSFADELRENVDRETVMRQSSR
jgi:hypothetical protein